MTKQYQVLQIHSIDAVIKKYWRGKDGLESSFMDASASFELLFRAPFNQVEDNEKGIRALSFTDSRSRVLNLPPHRLSYRGLYDPIKTRFLIETIIVFLAMLAS